MYYARIILATTAGVRYIINVKPAKDHFSLSLLVLWSLLLVPLAAEEGGTADKAFGLIIYAQGKEVSIFRKGEYISYDLDNVDVTGLPLLAGDMIQTDNGTFVEIQLHPTKSVLKIAENTTFTVTNLETSGGGGFDLAYGRVRAKVDKLTGRDPFSIRGRGAVAGVRGTDFGFDFIAEKEPVGLAASTKVYCFEGSVAVTRAEPASAAKAEPPAAEAKPGEKPESKTEAETKAEPPPKPVTAEAVVIKANEMVTIKTTPPAPPETPAGGKSAEEKAGAAEAPVFEKAVISENVVAFWEKNDFQAKPVEPTKVEEIFPAIQELLKSESLGPEKLKKAQPKAETKVKDELARPAEKDAGKTVTLPEVRKTEPAKPVTVENEWERQMKDLRKSRLRVGGGALVGLGFLTAAFGGLTGYSDTVFGSDEPWIDRSTSMKIMTAGGIFAVTGAVFILSTVFD